MIFRHLPEAPGTRQLPAHSWEKLSGMVAPETARPGWGVGGSAAGWGWGRGKDAASSD